MTSRINERGELEGRNQSLPIGRSSNDPDGKGNRTARDPARISSRSRNHETIWGGGGEKNQTTRDLTRKRAATVSARGKGEKETLLDWGGGGGSTRTREKQTTEDHDIIRKPLNSRPRGSAGRRAVLCFPSREPAAQPDAVTSLLMRIKSSLFTDTPAGRRAGVAVGSARAPLAAQQSPRLLLHPNLPEDERSGSRSRRSSRPAPARQTAPADAIVLFDGKNLDEWVSTKDKSPGAVDRRRRRDDRQQEGRQHRDQAQLHQTTSCTSSGGSRRRSPAPARARQQRPVPRVDRPGATPATSCRSSTATRTRPTSTARPAASTSSRSRS